MAAPLAAAAVKVAKSSAIRRMAKALLSIAGVVLVLFLAAISAGFAAGLDAEERQSQNNDSSSVVPVPEEFLSALTTTTASCKAFDDAPFYAALIFYYSEWNPDFVSADQGRQGLGAFTLSGFLQWSDINDDMRYDGEASIKAVGAMVCDLATQLEGNVEGELSDWVALAHNTGADAAIAHGLPEEGQAHYDFIEKIRGYRQGYICQFDSAKCSASGDGADLPVGEKFGDAASWGGYSNGKIPREALTPLSWAPYHRLHPYAAANFEALNEAYVADFGKDIYVTDSYRDYAGQVKVRQSWCAKGQCFMAAVPGTSNHGWATAVDLGTGGWHSATFKWLAANAPKYGWHNPGWAPTKGEHWHWEFWNDPTHPL